ncbi:SAM-dependent methyltransferase [Streptomyces sp. NRRL F-5053]|uniref:SAM-dependent methyltransferase n=1 Tax=Streptomyces sp. NRRL F-5053 TaxID=1463854 RepID=UPI0004C9891B
MARPGEAASGDAGKPHVARMYDYYLGGKTHYEVDVRAAEAAVATLPQIVPAARANRDFMIRATRTLTAEYGIRQFLDIGSGIPTQPNLHQVAQGVAPESRVVYTDNDPIVLQYAQALLHSTPEGRTAYLQASHGIADVPDEELSARLGDVSGIYQRGGTPITPRTRAQVARFFDGLELLEPGITMVQAWRPDPEAAATLPPEQLTMYAGVARKP